MTNELSTKVKSRPNGRLFSLRREILLPRSRPEVFDFFSDAHNLDRLTPPFLKFRVLTPRPIALRAGARIEYALRLRGLPIRWESEIAVWEPPERFVDVQERGPYRWWHHTHRFEPVGDSTRVIDEIEYRPIGGRLVDALFVRRDLRRVFDYRQERMAEIFGGKPAG